MDILELNDMKNSVENLLARARLELEEKRLQRQREVQIAEKTTEIEQEIKPLLTEVEAMLSQFDAEGIADSTTRQQLESKAAELRHNLENAHIAACQAVDSELILYEESLLNEQLNEHLVQWRQELKADLLETIAEQQDFFSATDAAVTVRDFVTDLQAINALEEVVEALIDRINALSDRGPVARLQYSHEQTLDFIYDKALENRSRASRPTEVRARVRHRSHVKRPNPYGELSGKVVIFGGHDRLKTSVQNRLRCSEVDLSWCTAQDGLQMAQQIEARINSADLILIVTGYASHPLTEKAGQMAQKVGKTPQMINTTGMTRILEAIEYGLKVQSLAGKLSDNA
ncbi:MAG: DUF2325 domain-containing protein [Spirulinaceae cyanobacterium RM2_2_10]|nr:DUF2325 domain-containing protein [Spirulinaceae cyanobacterium SM2_1_0]NJO18897.1 DUF2325 domain-containing protein [Spirulinaceae cyanobacterium RM2_2_10]